MNLDDKMFLIGIVVIAPHMSASHANIIWMLCMILAVIAGAFLKDKQK